MATFSISDGVSYDSGLSFSEAAGRIADWFRDVDEWATGHGSDELHEAVEAAIASVQQPQDGGEAALQKYADRICEAVAEAMGHQSFHGHGNYSVSAAEEAGMSLKVEVEEDEDEEPGCDMDDDDSRAELSDVWDATDTPIYRVIDDDGVNVAGAQLRRLTDAQWLYVDDDDGYRLISHEQAVSLNVVRDEDHVPRGWDAQGNVVEL